MNVSYLHRLRIDEFRAYRQGFSLELPPGPGVTLLVGPNGSGKTALFDAIEWCLTGQVHRLADLPDIGGSRNREYYGRFHPQRDADYECRVALDYGGTEVIRSQIYGPDGSPKGGSKLDGTDPVRLLTSADWTTQVDRESLPSYLRATHILTQAVDARWGRGRDTQTRSAFWNDLTHLSGEDLFNRVLTRLTSRATTQAFNQVIADREGNLREVERQLDDWEERLKRRQTLTESAVLDDIATPEEVLAKLSSIRDQLSQQWPELAPQQPVDESLPEQMLDWCRAWVRHLSGHLSAQQKRLEPADLLPALWAESEAKLAHAKRLSETARQEREEARQQYDAAAKSLADARTDEEQRQTEAHEALKRRDLILRTREAHRRRPELQRKTSETDQSIADLGELEQQQVQRVTEANKRLAAQEATTARFVELQQVADRLRALITRASPVVTAYKQLPQLRAEIDQTSKSSTDMGTKLANCAGRLREAEAALKKAEQVLVSRRQQASKVQDALSVIAAQISDADLTCPVCKSEWQAGELKRKAMDAAEAEDRLLVQAEAGTNELRERVEGIRLENGAFTAEQSAIRAKLDLLSEQERKTTEEFNALSEWPDLRGATLDDPVATLEHKLNRALQGAAEQEKALTDLPKHEQLSVALSEAEGALLETRTQLASVRESLVELRGELAQLDALLSANSEIIARIDASPSGWDEEMRRGADAVAEAEKSLAGAQQALNLVQAQFTQQEKTRREKDTRSRDLDADLEKLIETRNGIERAWKAAGLSQQPSNEAVATQKQRLASQEEVRSRIERELDHYGKSLKAYASHEQLAAVERELDDRMRKLGVNQIEDVSKYLRRQVDQKKRQVSNAKDAREAARRLGATAKDAAKDYSDRVLAPLNDLANAFSDALTVQSPLDVRLGAHTARGMTQLMAGASFRGAGRASASTLSAAHILSEGQMAAASFVQLLSMHVAYPWSTWRGLLLDDPLEYNDILSVAAFLDLIRNLVRFQRYQIVLSTHDGELADFILRKMDATGGIEWCLCEYAGNSGRGAVWSTRRSQSTKQENSADA